jgi:hypothetical protein
MIRFALALITAALVVACGGRASMTPQTGTMTGAEPQAVANSEAAGPDASTKLLALYTFNGTLADASGNGKTAHDSGTPTYVTGAPFGGKAIVFSGLGNAIVTAPLNISVAALKQVTFGGWFKATSIATPQYGVVSNDDGNFDRTIDIDTRDPGGGIKWSAFVGGAVNGKVPVVVGRWYFVAVSFNQAVLPGHYVLYVHSGTTPTVTVSGTDHFDSNSITTGVTIGRNPRFDHPFKGQAANVFFEHLILTPTQIANIIAHGPSALPR